MVSWSTPVICIDRTKVSQTATLDDSSAVQLHDFSDASETAYGAVSYLRVNRKCKLVMSKARLAPIKPTTIPRLELLVAVTATDLDQHIKVHLDIPIEQTFFWTDSTIVLHYINNKERRLATFVANRVAKIHERTDCSQCGYVDTASNPADDISRGMSASEILSSDRWVSGPTFLQSPEESWPTQPELGNLLDESRKCTQWIATQLAGWITSCSDILTGIVLSVL